MIENYENFPRRLFIGLSGLV